jgi:heme oxygenase
MSADAIATSAAVGNTSSEFPPILEELRDVAMRLHTREQAPREGQAEAPAKPAEPFVPTQADYLQFLVDSHAVYVALEEIVNEVEALTLFRNSGLERTQALEKDIQYMCQRFDLQRPETGKAGSMYAGKLKSMIQSDDDIPEFMCHYYNFYFAHLAGGRMIGKQMSKLLLDGEALEFYKWGDNVNELKSSVKALIEKLSKGWNRKERDNCINATKDAFQGGGAINGYLYGRSLH